MNTYEIQFYSRKPYFKRRQYYFRIVHTNGNIIAWSEGYNNRDDRNEACYRLVNGIKAGNYTVKDLDK